MPLRTLPLMDRPGLLGLRVTFQLTAEPDLTASVMEQSTPSIRLSAPVITMEPGSTTTFWVSALVASPR